MIKMRVLRKRHRPKKHETGEFLKAVELLGSGDPVKIVGAASALELLALESATVRARVVDVLCRYLRIERRCEEPEAEQSNIEIPEARQTKKVTRKYLDPHLEAVLYVLTRLNKTFDDVQLDLSRINFWNIYLNLDNAKMSLRKAKLVEAHLEDAALWKVHLEEANLQEAYLFGAYLWGAHLEGAVLGRANLEMAKLDGAHLEGAALWEAHLEMADLKEAHLKGVELGGAHLEEACLWKAHLEDAYLGEANLERANLCEAHLEGADLSMAHLEDSDLRWANLSKAKYGDNIWEAKWNDKTIFSNGQAGVPDVPKPGEGGADTAMTGKAI